VGGAGDAGGEDEALAFDERRGESQAARFGELVPQRGKY
jgi:hypothetical protein